MARKAAKSIASIHQASHFAAALVSQFIVAANIAMTLTQLCLPLSNRWPRLMMST